MSSTIKDVIAHLCKLLDMLYSANLRPEHFRLAKFNKVEDNVIPILLDVLFKCVCPHFGDIEELKKHMQSLKYSRKQFYQAIRFEDYGSREILLSLGFALVKTLNQQIQLKIKESVFSERYCFKNINGLSWNKKDFNKNNLNPREQKNYEIWLKGKVALNERAIGDHMEQITRIQSQLNKQIDMKATGLLTLYELLALKSRKYEEDFLKGSKEILEILSIYCGWLKKEKHFWKWMSTVLEEEAKDVGKTLLL